MQHLVTVKAPGTELSFSDQLIAARAELAPVLPPAAGPAGPILTDAGDAEHVRRYRDDYDADRKREWEDLDSDRLRDRDLDRDREEAADGERSDRDRRSRSWFEPRADDSPELAYADYVLTKRIYRRVNNKERMYQRLDLTVANLAEHARASPELTVLSAWEYVEAAINMLANRLGADKPASREQRMDFVSDVHADVAAALGYGPDVEAAMRRLLELRDDVRRGVQVSPLEAYDYAATALALRDALIATALAQASTREHAESAQPGTTDKTGAQKGRHP